MAFTLMGLIIYDGVVSRAIGNALLHPFSKSIFFAHFSPFFFCFEGLENRRFTADFMETKKTKKKKQIFFLRDELGGRMSF